MSEIKRTKPIKIRVTEAEYSALKAKCPKARLAEWMRETCLGHEDTRRKPPYPPVDPALLRQLAGMGNNLNQVARKLNSGEWSALERLQIVAFLNGIHRDLVTLKDQYR